MIDEDEFATVGVRFFQRWELAGFGPEYVCSWLLVPGSCFVSGNRAGEQGKAETQCLEEARERHWSGGATE